MNFFPRSSFLLLLTAIAALPACGLSSLSPQKPAIIEERPTEAERVMFVEKTPEGWTNWTVAAGHIIDESSVTRGDSLQLVIHNIDSSAGKAAGAVSRFPGGCTAVAARGRIWRENDSLLVELSNNFVFESGDGWKAGGQRLLWNGATLQANDSVTISKGTTRFQGESATIDPRRNRVTIKNVNGSVEGLKL